MLAVTLNFSITIGKIKQGSFEYLRISLGGNCPGGLSGGLVCPGTKRSVLRRALLALQLFYVSR